MQLVVEIIWCCHCIIKAHQFLPFHKVQEWTGKCYEDKSIFHNVVWCSCPGSSGSQHLQLLKAGLFPASTTHPRTAFTFEVLDLFLIDALECKTSASSFFEKLRRMANNSFLDKVPNRYRELMRVSRLWRDLMSRKWFGFGHNKEKIPYKSDLALFCPACPQPGINLATDWRDKMQTDGDHWLISQRYVVDGNFTTQHMIMKQPLLDISLSDGLGYMVTEQEYQTHLSLATESKECSSCSNHRAVNAANINRSNLRATGVGATAYSFLIIYDVRYQWSINFLQRVVMVAVGKFHLSAHKLACFARGWADQWGDLETLWAPFNKISPTARSMSQAHCQEVLDDHMRDSN
ncbi:uncharacterized protein EDB93DRAFT_1240253 [Suillus bovinus]|uniref:uncharacterized protein n=1 Tax=Suillus bovinus TaxID=48563 RepID=UPI001B878AB6|nr:uncharacterized protein EDB93DRAFT_1240253 [Suillus bovinus]KAG2150757.1 hypothetical protein EDB93DRAFT_1240253 [Suillus bovinus]